MFLHLALCRVEVVRDVMGNQGVDTWGHDRRQISVQPPLRAAEDTLSVFELHLQKLKHVTGFGAVRVFDVEGEAEE